MILIFLSVAHLVVIVLAEQYPKCFQDPFPKFLGALDANLWHDSIDVSPSTGAIVVGGSSHSVTLTGAPYT